MVRKLYAVAIIALSLMSLSTAALAAPPTMNLSSWEPVIENGAIVGGTQTVTVTNVLSETISGVAFPLDAKPCDCTVVGTTASDGRVDGDAWIVGDLAPGATATLTLTYGETPVFAAGAPGIDPWMTVGIQSALATLALASGLLVWNRRRFDPATA